MGCMTKMDGAHLSAWLQCLTASDDLEQPLGPEGREGLSALLDLPASYGEAGLHSLEVSADEELLGSFAGIAATLIAFCRKTKLPIYIKIVEAVEMLQDPAVGQCCMSMEGVKDASERMDEMREPLNDAETEAATELVRGSRFV